MGGSLPGTPAQGPFSVSPHPSPILPCSSPPTREGAGGSEMLDQAKALRMEAEHLYRRRDVNVEMLEKELQHVRKAAREDALKGERRVKEGQREAEALKADLCLAAQRAHREGSVARQWEAAWSKESEEKAALALRLQQVEEELAARRAEHAHTDQARAAALEAAAEEGSAMQHRLALLQDRHKEAVHLQHIAAAKAEAQAADLLHFHALVPRLEAELQSTTQDLAAHRERGARLEAALAEAQQRISSLQLQVEEGEARREEEGKQAEAKISEVREINAQLCGHRNAKQKIQYLLKVKEEKEGLERDKLRLEATLHSMLEKGVSPPSAAPRLSSPAASAAVGQHPPAPSARTPARAPPSSSSQASLSAAAANITPKDIFKRGGSGSGSGSGSGPQWKAPLTFKAESKVHLTQPRSPRLRTATRRGSSVTGHTCSAAAAAAVEEVAAAAAR